MLSAKLYCLLIIVSLFSVALTATKNIGTSDFEIRPMTWVKEDFGSETPDTYEFEFNQSCLSNSECGGAVYVIGQSGQIEIGGETHSFSTTSSGGKPRFEMFFPFDTTGTVKIIPSGSLIAIRIDMYPKNEDYDLMIVPTYMDADNNTIHDLTAVKIISFDLIPRYDRNLDWSTSSAFASSDFYDIPGSGKYVRCQTAGSSPDSDVMLVSLDKDVGYSQAVFTDVIDRCALDMKDFIEDYWDNGVALNKILWFDEFNGDHELTLDDLTMIIVDKDSENDNALRVVATLPEIVTASEMNHLEQGPFARTFNIHSLLTKHAPRFSFDFSSLPCISSKTCFVYVQIIGESGALNIGDHASQYTMTIDTSTGTINGVMSHRISSQVVVEIIPEDGTLFYGAAIDIIPTGTYSLMVSIDGTDAYDNDVLDENTPISSYSITFYPNPSKNQSWGLSEDTFANHIIHDASDSKDSYVSEENGAQELSIMYYSTGGQSPFVTIDGLGDGATVDIKRFMTDNWDGTYNKILFIDASSGISEERNVDEISPLKITLGDNGLKYSIPADEEEKGFLQKGLDYAKDNVPIVAGVGGGVLLLIILLCCMCCKKSNNYSAGAYGAPAMGGYGGYGGRSMGPPMRRGMY